jgi:hypothetical protein
MKASLLGLFLGSLCLGPAFGAPGAHAKVKIGAITWYSNYDEAMTAARLQHKPVWIHFGENPG